jgi:ABC-type multidrug transport system fused ATPase/permease subunit
MRTGLRNQVFDSIMVQDTAFFDGINTGELIARLASDADASIGPIQGLLGAPTDVILLIGGLFMSFVTAPRLAVLSLTGIGPIILVMRVYARFSKRLNQSIREALAQATSSATQSIENLRTVRAYGSETFERVRYRKIQYIALQRTTKEAVVGVGTSVLTDIIDLGATVFLLWYGGLLVLEESMTLGQLITFELYWGLVKHSYSDVVASFTAVTRAVGAASRVYSILDCTPDIEPVQAISDEYIALLAAKLERQQKMAKEEEENGGSAEELEKKKKQKEKDEADAAAAARASTSGGSSSGGAASTTSHTLAILPEAPRTPEQKSAAEGSLPLTLQLSTSSSSRSLLPLSASPHSPPSASTALLPAAVKESAAARKATARAEAQADAEADAEAKVMAANEAELTKLREAAAQLWSRAPTVRFEGVSFSYQQRADHQVLSEMDLTVPAGTVCALVGASGGGMHAIAACFAVWLLSWLCVLCVFCCVVLLLITRWVCRMGAGKTTIVNLLLRYYDPDEGVISLNGQDITEIPIRALRMGIGLVSQDTQLFATTIEGMHSLGRRLICVCVRFTSLTICVCCVLCRKHLLRFGEASIHRGRPARSRTSRQRTSLHYAVPRQYVAPFCLSLLAFSEVDFGILVLCVCRVPHARG